MYDNDMNHSTDIRALLEFDPFEYKVNPEHCFRFDLFNNDGLSRLHNGNDLSAMSDADLTALHMMLMAILKNVIEPEIENRLSFHNRADKEINELLLHDIQPVIALKETLMAQRLIPFKSKGTKKDSTDGEILDHGEFGGISYELYKRGSIHLFNKDVVFRKNCDLFKQELDKIDFKSMKEGDEVFIKGGGDTCDLVFQLEDGAISLELRQKEFSVISTLKGLLKKGIGSKV